MVSNEHVVEGRGKSPLFGSNQSRRCTEDDSRVGEQEIELSFYGEGGKYG